MRRGTYPRDGDLPAFSGFVAGSVADSVSESASVSIPVARSGHLVGFDELYQRRPALGGRGDLVPTFACLLDVRGDAEAHPGGGVACWLVAAALHLRQHAVVVGGVAGEVLLDGAELGCEQSGTGEHERLHDAGYASVAAGERVDGHEVQMSHGGTHADVGVEVFVRAASRRPRS